MNSLKMFVNKRYLFCSFNSRRKFGLKPHLARASTVSKRKFHFATEACIEELKQIKLKWKTEAKVNWAVSAYVQWHEERLKNFKYDVGIYFADLNNLKELEAQNLAHALCHFVPEVTKVRGEGLYSGQNLYQVIVGIQKYLNINKIPWQLVAGKQFQNLKTVLDNVMHEEPK